MTADGGEGAPAFEVRVASSAGFCRGVRRAVDLAEEVARRARSSGGAAAVSLGPLVHNQGEVERLAEAGLRPVEEEDLRGGEVVVVRSHGAALPQLERLSARCTLRDATCPSVRACQVIAGRMAAEGYAVLLVGDPGHAEVESVLSHALGAGGAGPAPARCVPGPGELPVAALAGVRRVAVLAQTTMDRQRFAAVVAACLERFVEVRAFNTICEATARRQDAALALARQVDVMLVLGDPHSANTGRLARICLQVQPHTWQVSGAGELDPAWLAGARSVGVTAGASTPDRVLQDMVQRLQELSRVNP